MPWIRIDIPLKKKEKKRISKNCPSVQNQNQYPIIFVDKE